MNERPFSPITNEPFKVQNYYIKLILLKLNVKKGVEAQDISYGFTIYKGSSKLQSSRDIPISLGTQNSYSLSQTPLNFVVINYNPNRNEQYALRLNEEGVDREKEIGEYVIDMNHFIDQFVISENGAFTHEGLLNDFFSVQFELYVEKSRYGVERLVRDIKNPKPKKVDEPETKITMQKIQQRKNTVKKEEYDEEGEENHSHAQKFNKFVPKRNKSLEQSPIKESIQLKKTEESEKRIPLGIKQNRNEPIKREQKKQVKSVPKIYEAEKMISKTRSNSMEGSLKESQVKEAKLKISRSNSASSQTKIVKKKSYVIEEPSLFEKMNWKLIVPVVLLAAAGVYFALFRGAQQAQKPLFPKLEETKPQKADKINKNNKKVKVGKGKK